MTSATGDVKEMAAKLEYYEALFSSDSLFSSIKEKFKTTSQLAAVIKLFLMSEKEIVTSSSMVLVAESYGRKLDHPDQYAKVLAWRVRKLFSQYGVFLVTHYAEGYELKAEDKEKLLEVLK